MRRRGGTVLITHDTSACEQHDNNNCKSSHHHSNECTTRWPMYTLVGFVSFVCYVNGFTGDFVHDDIPAVTLNKDVLAINPISHIFMNDFWGTPMADVNSHKSYRPLTTLTFRYYGIFMYALPRLMIRDADLLKQIGVKDFEHFTDHTPLLFGEGFDPLLERNLFTLKGEEWRDMRSTLSPAFTGSKMRGIFTLINECGHQLVAYLKENVKSTKGKHLDVELKDLLSRVANDVIGTSAFGIKCDSLKDPENDFFLVGREASFISTWRMFMINTFPSFMNLMRIGILPQNVCTYIRNLVTDTVAVRERENIIRPDMLHLMIQAKKGLLKHDDKVEVSAEFAVANEGALQGKIRKLTDDDVAAQAFIFFLAGFETVSTALCFTVYELAVNPVIQDRLYSEILDTIDASNQEDITYDTLSKMKYLDMIISETLRKWPPAPFTDRTCTKPYLLKDGDSEVLIPAGVGIIIPILGLHRDPKYYPNPDKYEPERFSDENKGKINLNAYLPFGVGPRICIGSRLALMEAKIILIHLVKNFEIIVTDKTTIPAVLTAKSSNMTLVNGFNVGLKSRM